MEGDIIYLKVAKKVEGYRQLWVYMDVCQTNPLLTILMDPAEKNSGWGHKKLTHPRMETVLERMAAHRGAGLSRSSVSRCSNNTRVPCGNTPA